MNYYQRSAKKLNTVTKIFILSFLILSAGYLVQKFFQYWNFQSPLTIKIRSPLKRIYLYENSRSIEPLPTTTPRKDKPSGAHILPSLTPTPKLKTEREIIMAQKHGEVLWKIYLLETSRGKNDYCRPNGYGGFGVMNEGKVVCYDTFQIAVERAEYWLTKNGVDKDLAVSLCLWNEGIAKNDCSYYKNYLTL